jgi:hypothetical protein
VRIVPDEGAKAREMVIGFALDGPVVTFVAALAELVPTAHIGCWLETSNSAFEGSTPVQVIEHGESDRICRLIWELRDGNSGD